MFLSAGFQKLRVNSKRNNPFIDLIFAENKCLFCYYFFPMEMRDDSYVSQKNNYLPTIVIILCCNN